MKYKEILNKHNELKDCTKEMGLEYSYGIRDDSYYFCAGDMETGFIGYGDTAIETIIKTHY